MTEQTSAPAPDTTPATAPVTAQAPAPAPSPATETPPASERPSWLPEKFKTPEDMAASYAALEKKLSGAPAPEAAPPPADLPPAADLSREDAEVVLKGRGLDADAIAAEFDKDGAISDETMAKMEAAGLPRSFVEQWVEGQKAVQAQTAQTLMEVVGGAETFKLVSDWASKNAPKPMLEAYNRAVDRGDVGLMQLALRGLHSVYVAAEGERPTLIQGDGAASNTGGYASQEEAVRAMSDPRYARDPAYRKGVEDRLSASPVFNARMLKSR